MYIYIYIIIVTIYIYICIYVNRNIKLVSTWPCGAFLVSFIKTMHSYTFCVKNEIASIIKVPL